MSETNWEAYLEIVNPTHQLAKRMADQAGIVSTPESLDFSWEKGALVLLKDAGTDYKAFDAAKELAALCISMGEPIPEILAEFTAGVLSGRYKPPGKTTRGGAQHEERDRHLAYLISEVSRQFGLKQTRGKDRRAGISAIDVLMEVFVILKMKPLKYSSLDNALNPKKTGNS